MSRKKLLHQFRSRTELHSPSGDYIGWGIFNIGDDVAQKRMKWEQYAAMVERTTQAQPLTAQELDLRNFFQHNQVQFWVHPFWKVIEDQCFYVYDFAFHFTLQSENPAFNSSPQLEPITSPDADLWLLECSYTTSKPANAKQYLRKRCAYFDRKSRAAKRRGFNTILLLEALHVPPQVLKKSLPTLEHVDLLFTSVVIFKEWALSHIYGDPIRNEPVPLEDPETTKHAQVRLNGFLKTRKTFNADPSLTNLPSSASKPHANRKRTGRKGQ